MFTLILSLILLINFKSNLYVFLVHSSFNLNFYYFVFIIIIYYYYYYYVLFYFYIFTFFFFFFFFSFFLFLLFLFSLLSPLSSYSPTTPPTLSLSPLYPSSHDHTPIPFFYFIPPPAPLSPHSSTMVGPPCPFLFIFYHVSLSGHTHNRPIFSPFSLDFFLFSAYSHSGR